MHGYSLHSPLDTHAHQSTHVLPPLQDDYDDGEDDGLTELPSGVSLSGYTSAGLDNSGGMQGMSKAGDKQVRRRSSKACDQCRKSKCKCERTSMQEPCKNCVLLGTPCTFLGPSRKRGPPKGYIDAIEARLHQTEALIGILISSKDSRAKTLLEDLSEDPLAKDIIDRVNNSSYGHKGRKRGATTNTRSRPAPVESKGGDTPALQATHPSSEWQDSLTARLDARAAQRSTLVENGESFGETDNGGLPPLTYPPSPSESGGSQSDRRAPLTVPSSDSRPTSSGAGADASLLASAEAAAGDEHRRQRRRVDHESGARSPSSTSISGRSQSPAQYTCLPPHPALLPKQPPASASHKAKSATPEAPDLEIEGSSEDEFYGSGEDELAVAVGQLSMNEDDQVRYHGKASGLHLLGNREREDGRNEGGIWRFPKARVWPPLPLTARTPTKGEEDFIVRLPPQEVQEHLLELYFSYVHAQLPIIHKQTFMEMFRARNIGSASSPMSDASSPPPSQSSAGGRPQRIPTLLLLAMFSIAARYSGTGGPAPAPGEMWNAGDSYMEDAKVLLHNIYAQSRPTTCQALLLLGYREVGIGAMAQAWVYIGMAVRMAQDLGLHKNADKWSNVGKVLFTDTQLQERRRIWYGCVVLDKYISAYIGRPVAIFENDFDTELPSDGEPDEMEGWLPHPSPVFVGDVLENHPPRTTPVTGHVISCFNESAKLSIILSMIMQAVYPIRPHTFRQPEFARIEQLLDKWYIDLPEHLRFDPSSPKYYTRPPHVLTLHAQYWCTVILLHRPFTRHLTAMSSRGLSPSIREQELRANARKNYDQCVRAANQITAIVSIYAEHHCPRRAAVFLCFYVFTAAIMHVSTLTTYAADPQASEGLRKCMFVLNRMHYVWPAAWRANELLHGVKVLPSQGVPLRISTSERTKRIADTMEEGQTAQNAPTNGGAYRQGQGFGENGSGSSQPTFPLQLEIPSAEPQPFYQSYPRWNAENPLPTLTSSLSTSVLPQQYSTGMVDDRAQRSQDRPGRYPQYWSDYTAMGQIDTSFNMPVMGGMVSPQSAQADQQMYAADQYSLYNDLSQTNQQ
ncbi:uncharacterized protein PHACADRAFT_254069 [Phanerochaete carnosa HHB-10118-sp]|uniref:Zn(2)-C6 fungal-type domain-containing protein n=1 Tax=Phanerochaete carnosa (strain HHB-10118-sp) TaxID=650164 RepID=K5X1V1_PHACS|nr:uncharacterized protein PHACADRAFT_254069 [Phanerochaete carnosa HHB-10118-sp]EKM56762.1 hypothetical protein PHACADRAFT_254069 [Phanerochaete carnosa HHB-10118-sp]